MSNIDNPAHYGGKENPYETIKVIEATFTEQEAIGFSLGNAMKYLSRYRQKNGLEDLKKCAWYVNHAINFIEATGADVGGKKPTIEGMPS